MARPIIVGMHNPHSWNPRDALAPYPPKSAGARLWALTGFSKIQTWLLYDRRNLCEDEWEAADPRTRQILALCMMSTFKPGSTVVLLGHDVAKAFNSSLSWKLKRVWLHPQTIDGITWRIIPHPSGRNRIYNDPVVRQIVGILLVELAKAGT